MIFFKLSLSYQIFVWEISKVYKISISPFQILHGSLVPVLWAYALQCVCIIQHLNRTLTIFIASNLYWYLFYLFPCPFHLTLGCYLLLVCGTLLRSQFKSIWTRLQQIHLLPEVLQWYSRRHCHTGGRSGSSSNVS